SGEFQIGYNIKPLDPTTVGSIVRYGKHRYPLRHEAKGKSLVYSQLYPFEGLQNYTSGIIHHARLTAMSDIYSFRTMPASGPKSYPRKIAIFGDLGLTYNTTATISHVKSNNPDLVVLVGDVCYANLYLTNGTGADCYSCSFSNTPIHETYQPRWDYWGRLQYRWLERDLANVDRSITPWLVAVWHPPWYNSYNAHYREVECMRVEMEELIYSYGVDIVFNGHVCNSTMNINGTPEQCFLFICNASN
ncbi:unnamed protein product, partial [Linum tenue]